MPSLFENLSYTPVELKFGTSGRRGEVIHLTQLEIYINALAELEYLQSLSPQDGGVARDQEFYFAIDLRPSSPAIAKAIVRAIEDSGLRPVNLGRIPTPALTYYALSRGRGSIMLTGSHIPFDRNGYKVNTSRGELLKKDEAPIGELVRKVRQGVYNQPYADSPFGSRGALKTPPRQQPETRDAATCYLNRYLDFFAGQSLDGMRLLVYQHSAVGRDLLVDLLREFGAEVAAAGRSETFVPIDTENIDDAQLAVIQRLYDAHRPAHAVLSLDGDSDRPLVLGVEPSGSLRFFGGDLLGMITAEYLHADAVVVPITCNDGIDLGSLKAVLEPKTKVGSPYVIEGMERARAKGKRAVCGWEANGGFLTGCELQRNGRRLSALPTRDAFLPILAVLFSSREKRLPLTDLFARLPARFSRAALLRPFPRDMGQRMVERFSPPHQGIREELEQILGTPIARLDHTDGVRILCANGEVVHFRPSGNADEMRIYAVAATQSRADELARQGVAEPDGFLLRLARAL